MAPGKEETVANGGDRPAAEKDCRKGSRSHGRCKQSANQQRALLAKTLANILAVWRETKPARGRKWISSSTWYSVDHIWNTVSAKTSSRQLGARRPARWGKAARTVLLSSEKRWPQWELSVVLQELTTKTVRCPSAALVGRQEATVMLWSRRGSNHTKGTNSPHKAAEQRGTLPRKVMQSPSYEDFQHLTG